MAKQIMNPGMMVEVAKRLNQQNEEWMGSVRRIYDLQNQLAGMWRSPASEQFSRAFSEEQPLYQSLYQMMETYAQAIQTAASNTVRAEEEISQIIKKR